MRLATVFRKAASHLNLRSFLDDLEAREPGSVCRVRDEVDPAYEITAMALALERRGRYPVLWFERVRGARGRAPEDFRIAIRGARPVWQAEAAVLLEFVEEQYRGGASTSRRSTALFTDQPGAPNHVVWRHLQETWIGSD